MGEGVIAGTIPAADPRGASRRGGADPRASGDLRRPGHCQRVRALRGWRVCPGVVTTETYGSTQPPPTGASCESATASACPSKWPFVPRPHTLDRVMNSKHPQHARLPKWAASWGNDRCPCGSRTAVQKTHDNNVMCLGCALTVRGCLCLNRTATRADNRAAVRTLRRTERFGASR